MAFLSINGGYSSVNNYSNLEPPHKKRKFEEEIEELECKEQLPPFDIEIICNTILFGPTKAADELIAQNNSILLAFNHYTPQETLNFFTEHMVTWGYSEKNQNKVKKEVLYLCSMAIRNSRYMETMHFLEKNVLTHLTNSTKEVFNSLIQKAKEALSKEMPNTLKEFEETLQNNTKIIAESNTALDVYCYLDPEYRVRLELLINETKTFLEEHVFGNSKKHFATLCQQLEINQHERKELSCLKQELLNKNKNLRELAKPFYNASSTGESKLLNQREILFQRNLNAFWQAGIHLLDSAFHSVLKKRYIPRALIQAVNTTSKSALEWNNLHFKNLEQTSTPSLENGYVHNAWIEFLGPQSKIEDLEDFIRSILKNLPEDLFTKLENALKTSSDKNETILSLFTAFFQTQFRGPINFASLKRWHEKSS